MAAIVGIVATLAGPIIEIGKCVASPIKRQFAYLCCFNSNIQSLRDEARNLENKRVGLQREVDAAEKNAELIVPEVVTWFEKVENKIQVDKSGIDDEVPTLKNGCWGIKSRYRLSRKAVKLTGEMKELVEERNMFDRICTPPPPSAHVPIPLGTTYEFQSRKQIEEEIMKALKAKEIRTMGICGMGGVGKTTMAKRIINRLRDENIFQEICIVVVSQQVDMFKIQDEIAESLALKLEERSLSARANKLRARLIGANTKRILIVLDDVWEKLKFDDLGIPFENERCTILLTSRNRDVLNKMDAKRIFALEILSKAEAWFLFKEKAGSCVDNNNLRSIAENVVEECQGLPIALITVAGALKDKTTHTFWEDALQQLRSFNPEDMSDVIKDVYNPLKLSYTYLESRHAKSLFLLCGLFPEDVDISLEELVSFCMGLRMFYDLDFSNTSEGTLEKARKRVFTIVDMLKNRFLLLEGWRPNHVKMHDVVRDVAIYIASNEANEVRFNSMCSSREYTYGWVSVCSKKVSNLLRMHAREGRFEINDFPIFEEVKELNVLSFENIPFKSLPLEVQSLKHLRTLRLEFCHLENLSVVGELLSLEILYCCKCFGIVELPVEIGKLNKLKLLDFSECFRLARIPPGIISNLVELEEFKMLSSFGGWESAAKVQGQDRRNASLNEFENLSKLTCLEIQIDDFTLAAEEISFPTNIVNYLIRIGNAPLIYYISSHETRGISMKLGAEIKLGSWVLGFISRSNNILLEVQDSNCSDRPHGSDLPQAHNMKSLISIDEETELDLFQILGPLSLYNFPNLDRPHSLDLPQAHNMKSLISIDVGIKLDVFSILESLVLKNLPNLEEIFDGEVLDSSNSFKNLRNLHLIDMPALKHLCKRPNTNVSLDNLHSIEIRKCSNLVNLFSFTIDSQSHNASVDDLLCIQKTHFPMLGYLSLKQLDKLEVIWNAPIPEGSNSFSNLRELVLSHLPEMTHLWKSSGRNISLNNLSKIDVRECHKLRNLFSSTMSMDFILQLEKLEIESCKMMELVLLVNEENENGTNQCHGTIPFPKLEELRLCFLASLTAFSKGIETVEFPMLVKMSIYDCPKLTSLLSFTGNDRNLAEGHDNDTYHLYCSKKVSLGSLKEISIGMDDKSNIWCRQIPLDFFRQLEKLEITACNGIKSLFSSSIVENLVSLKYLTIKNCNEMVKVIEDNEEMLCGESRILFPSLREVRLYFLPKLESFCNWRCNIQLPSLESAYIDRCPSLEFFTVSSLSTPNLKITTWDDEYLSDLNSETQLRFQAEHRLCSTEKIKYRGQLRPRYQTCKQIERKAKYERKIMKPDLS